MNTFEDAPISKGDVITVDRGTTRYVVLEADYFTVTALKLGQYKYTTKRFQKLGRKFTKHGMQEVPASIGGGGPLK